MLSYDEARRVFDYDPAEGILRWKLAPRRGMPAGCECKKPGKPIYIVVRVGKAPGILYAAHRVIWLWMTGSWPVKMIDHKDLDGTNNKWDNLRLATNSQNMMNANLYKNNRTGIKGVTFRRGKFRVRIQKNGAEIYLGDFGTIDEARAARDVAAKMYHGEFARSSMG
jgi:HNH endonuclease/AP2 domain